MAERDSSPEDAPGNFQEFLAGCLPVVSVGAASLGSPDGVAGAVICLVAVEPDAVLHELFGHRDRLTDAEFFAQWEVKSEWRTIDHQGGVYARLECVWSRPLKRTVRLLFNVRTTQPGLSVAAEGGLVFLARQQSMAARASHELLTEALPVSEGDSTALKKAIDLL